MFPFSAGFLEGSDRESGVAMTHFCRLLWEREIDLMCMVMVLDNSRSRNPLLLLVHSNNICASSVDLVGEPGQF